MQHKDIYVEVIKNAEAFATGTAFTGEPYDLGTFAQNGQFAIEYYSSAAGASVTISYEMTNDNPNSASTTWVRPGGNTIAQNVPASGNTARRDIVEFSPPLSRFLRIYASNTSGTDTTFTLRLIMQ